MESTASKFPNHSIVWILPEGHLGLPEEYRTLNPKVYRLRSQPKINSVRSSFSLVVAWDRRRAVQGLAGCCYLEQEISSLSDLTHDAEDIPIVVSGPRTLAECLCKELRREIYWLSITGNGATDPKAVWANWLTDSPSISIELFSCLDAKRWKRFGLRELRVYRSSPALTQSSLIRASISLVERLAIRAGPETNCGTQCEFVEPPLAAPHPWLQSFYVSMRIVSKTIMNRLSRSNRLSDQWVIGVKKTEVSNGKGSIPYFPEFRDFHLFEPGSLRFIADPFLFRVGETLTLFFEEYLYSDRKGRLKAITINSSGQPTGSEVTILEKPYHLSFPLIFTHAAEPDAFFLLPEQSQSGNTVLYRSAKSTVLSALKFQEDTTLLPGFPGIDPVICECGDRFYLFTSNGSYGNSDNNLQLFVAENLRGPYQDHPKSPIKHGLRGSRMAGPIVKHRHKLYRPGQDCQSRYGGQIILYYVDLLSPTEYSETEVAIFSPDSTSPYGLGCHTVVWFEGFMATDGLRQIANSGAMAGK